MSPDRSGNVGSDLDEAVGPVDAASRLIAATPEKVFAALVDADALCRWLPPSGMNGRFDRFDARPGGSYRLILTYSDNSDAGGKATDDSDIVEARFVDIVPNARVVQAIDFVSDDPAFAGTMTMTWDLVPVGESVRVEIRAATSSRGSLPKITWSASTRRWRISLSTPSDNPPGRRQPLAEASVRECPLSRIRVRSG